MTLEESLKELRDSCGSIASAIVSRDGLVVAADMPSNASKETFSIMCATIMGAGTTAASELRRMPPHKVMLEAGDSRIYIFEAGRRNMVVVVVGPEVDVGDVERACHGVIDEARQLAQ